MYRVAIVVSKFNEIITHNLQRGADSTLTAVGNATCETFWVPGAFELPLMAQWLAPKYDGVLVLGAVIKGTTDHYEYVCSSVANGTMNVQLKTGVPVTFGVLTCDTLEQAFDRCGGKHGNKGSECAKTLLDMIYIKNKLGTL